MNDFSAFIKSRRKVNMAMVAINIIVFIVLEIMGDTHSAPFMLEHGASYAPMVLEGQYWRLFSCMFLHFGFEHLAYNMFSLIFLGDIIESVMGPVRYLIIYIIGGLGGNIISVMLSMRSGRYAVAAGASGAIFACMGAFLYFALRNRSSFGPSHMRRLGMMIMLMIMQSLVDKGVDNAAHIGGFVSGFILAVLLYHPRKLSVRRIE
jgi:rhomboid protease GluP